ncbi:MAG: recombinase family protein [Anaerolineales bacterium]
MKEIPSNPKITPGHLARKAIVYLRQSSGRQVKENLESQRLQYALVERARVLGWKQVEVFDQDLGCSAGLGAASRAGFDRLIASVALGEVGIIFSRELSRLFRTDKDFCHLMEVCGLFDCLLGDEERVYDLNVMDDQLVLGIKGTLSVVELKGMKLRLQAGMEEKARRGELSRLLAPGYVRDAMGAVVKDPDKRVRDAMGVVFKKFRESWSIRQTFKWFHDEGVELPVNKSVGGRMQLVWQLPTQSFIRDVVQSAFYLWAYVYGRRPVEVGYEGGRLLKRQGSCRKAEECKVFIREHHEGYIDWETYEENRRIIEGNALNREGEETVRAVRAGQGLLAGVLRCGRCGRKLQVRYWGKSGTAARYVCKGDFDAGGRYCLGFGGSTVDRRFSEELLQVLSPLGVEASLRAVEQLKGAGEDKRQLLFQQLQQVEYEAQRAFEQYNTVDARNRLVSAELERRWNAKLEEVKKIKADLEVMEQERRVVSEEEREKILSMGRSFAEVWESEGCPKELKKKIVRSMIEGAIVDLDEATKQLHFVIHWKGGTHTEFEMDKPRSGVGQKTLVKDVDLIRQMAERYGDDEIARVLNKLGRRTGKEKRWNEQRVRTVRRNYSIPGQKRSKPDPEILTIGRAAKYCGVSSTTIRRLVASGLLKKQQVAPWAPWEIRREDLDSDSIRGIMEVLRKTGKLVLSRVDSETQEPLFQ